jgi:hypothetical protein
MCTIPSFLANASSCSHYLTFRPLDNIQFCYFMETFVSFDRLQKLIYTKFFIVFSTIWKNAKEMVGFTLTIVLAWAFRNNVFCGC